MTATTAQQIADSQGAKVVEFAVYSRSESGALTRHDQRLDSRSDLSHFCHREKLAGWPESAVFWTKEFGEAAGVAMIVRR